MRKRLSLRPGGRRKRRWLPKKARQRWSRGRAAALDEAAVEAELAAGGGIDRKKRRKKPGARPRRMRPPPEDVVPVRGRRGGGRPSGGRRGSGRSGCFHGGCVLLWSSALPWCSRAESWGGEYEEAGVEDEEDVSRAAGVSVGGCSRAGGIGKRLVVGIFRGGIGGAALEVAALEAGFIGQWNRPNLAHPGAAGD